ncbi:ISSod13, transposase [Wolbachia endosymbiont of Armadillidium vulgare str. wVulC]|nr:ISSod13, transposase [Wolbachia endosymbiont of Armadillidium vulgare str. wVulC]
MGEKHEISKKKPLLANRVSEDIERADSYRISSIWTTKSCK